MISSSNKGLAGIAREEALVTVAFLDDGSPAQGFSHHGPEIQIGDAAWDIPRSMAALLADTHICAVVLGRVITVPLPQTCGDALISLAYHTGIGTISRGPIIAAINAGNLSGAAALFTTSGFKDQGRLEREAALFLTGDYGEIGTMHLFEVDPHAHPSQYTVVPFPYPFPEAA